MCRIAVVMNVNVIHKIEPEHINIRQEATRYAVEQPGTRGNRCRFQAVEQLRADGFFQMGDVFACQYNQREREQ